MGLTVKNLAVNITKDSYNTETGMLTLNIPVREYRAEAIKMGCVPNEDGEVFLNLNYKHIASGFRFTYKSSIALGTEVDPKKAETEATLMAELDKLRAQLKELKSK